MRGTQKMLFSYFVGLLVMGYWLLITSATPAYAIQSKSVIPDFNLAVPLPEVKGLTQEQFNKGEGLGIYIVGVYKFAISFAAIAAMLVLVYGGVLWLTARGDSGQVGESKKVITNALVGLILALGSYTFLWIFNPRLVSFKPLEITRMNELKLAFEKSQNTDFKCDDTLFNKYGFPQPTAPRPLGSAEKAGFQKMSPHFAKAGQLLNIDPAFIAMWPIYEGFTNGDGDNCGAKSGPTHDLNPNTACGGWDGNCEGQYWQVGYGVWPGCEGTRWLNEAFQKMYGDTSNAAVQRVGNQAITNSSGRNKITYVSSFPNSSLNDIVNGAKNGDQTSRMHMATLMKDPAISAYLVGKHFTDVERANKRPNYASVMAGWGSYYDPQKIANTIAGICKEAGDTPATSPSDDGAPGPAF